MSDPLLFMRDLDIYESENCIEQFRFPRTKNRRIQNKWKCRDENFRPSEKAWTILGKTFFHPETLKKMIGKLQA